MKKNNKKNEDMMFLGINGFEEIESLPSVRETETSNRTESVVNQSVMKALRKRAAKLAKSLKDVRVFKAVKSKASFKHSTAEDRGKVVYKKRAILAVAASVTALMLSFATVASALGSESESTVEPVATVAPATTATQEPVTFVGIGDTAESEISGLYIDGKFMGAVPDGNELQDALDKFLANAKEGYDNTTTAEFANSVEVKPYDGKDVTSVDMLINSVKDKLSVRLETDWTYEDVIDYKTETVNDDSKPSGYEEIAQAGEVGAKQVTIRLTYIDGVQTEAAVKDEKVWYEPVTEKKTVGTGEAVAETSSDSAAGGSGASTGGFMWPAPHTHSITSYMEWRWGRMHNGIDIAGGGDYGQPFVAADGGTVVWSGDDGGGYGNYVIIDHGNGYTTVYAHASELCCSIGDQVSQGQTIGYIGSTGNSTGPHLHFEVRLNGEYMDPTAYVS